MLDGTSAARELLEIPERPVVDTFLCAGSRRLLDQEADGHL